MNLTRNRPAEVEFSSALASWLGLEPLRCEFQVLVLSRADKGYWTQQMRSGWLMEVAGCLVGAKLGVSQVNRANRSCSSHDRPIRRYVQKVNTPHSEIDPVQSRLFPTRPTVDDRGPYGIVVP